MRLGERIKLMGMQRKKKLEGKSGEVERIVQDQGKMRVRLHFLCCCWTSLVHVSSSLSPCDSLDTSARKRE